MRMPSPARRVEVMRVVLKVVADAVLKVPLCVGRFTRRVIEPDAPP